MKYTCPCCGYKTLEEEPPVHMKFVIYVIGKMMMFSLIILTLKAEQMKFR